MQTKEAQVLAAARDALMKVASERDEAVSKIAHLEGKLDMVRVRLECEKVAAQMHEKGINADQDFTDLVEDLEKAAEDGRLPVIQEAVNMTAPDMGTKTAFINNDEYSGSGPSQFEQFIVGQVG